MDSHVSLLQCCGFSDFFFSDYGSCIRAHGNQLHLLCSASLHFLSFSAHYLGANHSLLFSGPVCEWDFYEREGGGGGREERCICRHADTTVGGYQLQIMFFYSIFPPSFHFHHTFHPPTPRPISFEL